MALASTTLPPMNTDLSLWFLSSSPSLARRLPARFAPIGSRITSSRGLVTASLFANENRELVIVGAGNAAGYVARTFVENGMADGRFCIVTKEAYAPYERPALTKAYLFPPEKKPTRLPMFLELRDNGGLVVELILQSQELGHTLEELARTMSTGSILAFLVNESRSASIGMILSWWW